MLNCYIIEIYVPLYNDKLNISHTHAYIWYTYNITYFMWHLNVYFLYSYLSYSCIDLLIIDLLLFIQMHLPTYYVQSI